MTDWIEALLIIVAKTATFLAAVLVMVFLIWVATIILHAMWRGFLHAIAESGEKKGKDDT